jgi:hypothetical protein
MKKIIKIEILVEKEFATNLYGEFKITDLIFTEYDRLLNFDEIKENYRKALKKLEGFTTITATLLVYNDGEWKMTSSNIQSSFRYVNRYGDIKMSRWDGYSYPNFLDALDKSILADIKELVEKGNRKYIELIKYNN